MVRSSTLAWHTLTLCIPSENSVFASWTTHKHTHTHRLQIGLLKCINAWAKYARERQQWKAAIRAVFARITKGGLAKAFAKWKEEAAFTKQSAAVVRRVLQRCVALSRTRTWYILPCASPLRKFPVCGILDHTTQDAERGGGRCV
eukprot:SAG22_NODE_886_length_6665_cov_3.040359_3_plen_145_part_00